MQIAISADTSRSLMSAEEFLDWLEPGTQADLIDGKVMMHSPVTLRHADLLNFMDRLLGSYVGQRDLGRLYREVVAVRLSARNVFLPDLAFFSKDQLSHLKETYADTAPRLAVEALSDWSADRDVGPKFAEYEEHGVREYWILDPKTQAHSFFRREGELMVEFAHGEEIIRSEVVEGFWMRRSWLNPDDLPKATDCLEEVLRGQP